jgi:hypothetical protein
MMEAQTRNVRAFFDGANGACSDSHSEKKLVAYNAGAEHPFHGNAGITEVLPAAPL